MISAVHKGAGEHDVSAEIRYRPGSVAAFSHLVLHRVHLLHRRTVGLAGRRTAHHKIWEVSTNRLQNRSRLKRIVYTPEFLPFSVHHHVDGDFWGHFLIHMIIFWGFTPCSPKRNIRPYWSSVGKTSVQFVSKR